MKWFAILAASVVFVAGIFSCGSVLDNIDNPLDQEASGGQEYPTVEYPNEIETVSPDGSDGISWLSFICSRVIRADSYHLQIAKDRLFTEVEFEKADYRSNSMSVSGGNIRAGVYYWRVRAHDAAYDEWGRWSEACSFSVREITLVPVPGNDGTAAGSTPLLQWNELPGASGYELQLAGTAEAVVSAPVNPVKSPEFRLSESLSAGDTRYWRVRPVNESSVPGPWSETFSFHAAAPAGAVALEMVTVIAPQQTGVFSMGTASGEPDERPVHTVTLTRPFAMSRYEVTNEEFAAVMNWAIEQGFAVITSGNITDPSGKTKYLGITSMDWGGPQFGISVDGNSLSAVTGREDHPAVGVTWYGATAFCNFLSMVEGRESCNDLSSWTLDFTKNGYRLPTEAEWEYAAHGTTGFTYPWGDTLDGSYGNYGDSGDPFDNGTTPVGYYDGSRHGGFQTHDGSSVSGIYDLAGNAWEWCIDRYGEYGSSPVQDPTGPDSSSMRIIRGGSWYGEAYLLRAASRGGTPPAYANYNIGFRPVRRP